MSLYRQAGGFSSRMLAVAALVALLAGLLIGYLLGRGSVDDPSVAEVAADARAELRPAAAGIELIPFEYESAVVGREGAAEPTELEATKGAAERAAAALEASAADMEAIDPDGYAAAQRSLRALSAAIDQVAPPARVEALAESAQARIEALAAP
jgi:hypothetical protein